MKDGICHFKKGRAGYKYIRWKERDTDMENCRIGLDFLGGAMEVGASSILVEMCGYRILLDAGIRQRVGADPLPDFRRIQERGGLDAIVVSHAHMDHTGSLPVISRAYPLARVYMTSMSIDLVRVLLYDSIKLMNRQEDGIPHYAERDVEELFGRMMAVRYEQPMEILPGITLTLYQAEHIAGAACIYLQSREGSLFYSGDFSVFAQNTIEGIRIPKLRPDVAIVESTYGDRLHSNRQVEERVLIDTAAECIEKGGKMLIPTFALGRAQEVLLILRRAMNKGELPKVRIFVDGMVRDMNTAYERNPWFLKNALARKAERGGELFYSDEIRAVSPRDSREELLKAPGPAIFVASSGMLTGGPSVEYAKIIAPMENGYLVITGYQDEEAPGRQIVDLLDESNLVKQNSVAPESGCNPVSVETGGASVPSGVERFLTLGGARVPVRCTLKRAGLSAHADKAEIEGLLERLSARNVFLVHGDADVIPRLADDLRLDYRTRIFVPKPGDSEEIYLRSPRQQLKKSFPWSMQRKEALSGREKEFYQYLQAHYPNGKFTIAELAFIWSGKHDQPEEYLFSLQETLAQSSYFARDEKRLFLFVCRSEEEWQKELEKSQTVTPQKLQQEVEACFAGFPYRKISYFMEKEEVFLLFDFPAEAEAGFDRAAEQFQERTGWIIRKNAEPNEHAIQTWLRTWFGSAIQKISIRKMESVVVLRLKRRPEADTEAIAREFEKKTGYLLCLEGEGLDEWKNVSQDGRPTEKTIAAKPVKDGFFMPLSSSEPAEQNLAISCVDMEFAGAKYPPYKKSVMSDACGKYLQLSLFAACARPSAAGNPAAHRRPDPLAHPDRSRRKPERDSVDCAADLPCTSGGTAKAPLLPARHTEPGIKDCGRRWRDGSDLSGARGSNWDFVSGEQ
ncbi:MAG: MBL fold metallo-hydrolase [Clostridiales bacterium]|nr:MBL fold metallo-hydrolase [Clostridiales bacterium]